MKRDVLAPIPIEARTILKPKNALRRRKPLTDVTNLSIEQHATEETSTADVEDVSRSNTTNFFNVANQHLPNKINQTVSDLS